MNPYIIGRSIDAHQREAMAIVAQARLQRQAARATWEGKEQKGGFARLVAAVRLAFQRDAARPVPAAVRIRKI